MRSMCSSYRNRETGELHEFSIDDEEWRDESRWEWVETRVENESSAVQTLVSEFSLSDPEGNVTEDLLTREGPVYLICVTDIDDIRDGCRHRLRRVVERAAEENATVVCITPKPLRNRDLLPFSTAATRCDAIISTLR